VEVLAVFAKRVSFAGLALFAILNLTDYVQTYALLTSSGGKVYEANPLADAFLDHLGWGGLAAFKAATVAMVVVSVVLLLRRRPSAGIGVVVAGCIALTAVTLYSHQLVTAAEPSQHAKSFSARRTVRHESLARTTFAAPGLQGGGHLPRAE